MNIQEAKQFAPASIYIALFNSRFGKLERSTVKNYSAAKQLFNLSQVWLKFKLTIEMEKANFQSFV